MKPNDQALPNVRAGDSSGKPKFRRRQIIVKRGFQFKYGIIMFLLFGLSAFMVWWETYQSLAGLVESGFIRDPGTMIILGKINQAVLVKVSFALLLVWVLSMLLSHYLAGPIYRIESCLKSLRDGDLTVEAHLRAHDELKDVAVVYNEAVTNARTAVEQDRERLRRAREKLSTLGNKVSGTDKEELEKAIQELDNVQRYFKTSRD